MLSTVDWTTPEREITIRGVNIKVSAEAINAVHRLPNPSKAELRAQDHEENEP